MPVNISDKIPAIEELLRENIFVMNKSKAAHQDIRPLRIAILNLMPLKISTETMLIRLLSNTPLQVEIDLLKIKGHTSKNTPIEHMQAFYVNFDEVKHKNYDGLIITGAPIEHMEFEEVSYWDDIKEILDWADSHVTSSMFICWASMAALYHYYGVPKHVLETKLSGVFEHQASDLRRPIFRGFDDLFHAPHSRHTEVRKEDIEKVEGLEVIAESKEAGVFMVASHDNRRIFITGHSEYSPLTLDHEYKRDHAKGLEPQIPLNYYPDNNPKNRPVVRWRGHGNLLFSNWLNYHVYQNTPFHLEDISE